jgi:hypothetical protein
MRRFLAATAALTLVANLVIVSPALAWPSEVEGQPSAAEYAEGNRIHPRMGSTSGSTTVTA